MSKLVATLLLQAVIFNPLLSQVWAEEPAHKDLIAAMNTGQGTGPNRIPEHLPQDGELIFKSGSYKLVIYPKSAYTVVKMFYKDALIGMPAGANGAVILTEQARQTVRNKTCKGDPWIGTAHGGEVIYSVICTVDGKECELVVGGEFSGKRIVIEKNYTQYKFKARTTLVLTPDGLEEQQEMEAMEEFFDLHNLYFFMHPWPTSTTKWLAGFPDGSEEGSEFAEKESITLYRKLKLGSEEVKNYQPKWFAQYDSELKLGILQYVPEPIPGSTLIKVAKNYHKHYTVLPVRGSSFKKGDTIKYSMFSKILEKETGNWSATREAVSRLK